MLVDPLLIVAPIAGVLSLSHVLCCAVRSVLYSFTVTLVRERRLIVLLCLSFLRPMAVIVMLLLLTVP